MAHRRLMWGLLALGLMWMPSPASGALAVFETGQNLVYNFTQAIQSIAMVANQVLDLTPIDEQIVAPETASEMIGILVNLACHPPSLTIRLSFRLADICSAFESLFPPPEQIPDRIDDLIAWQRDKDEAVRQSAATAARAQALIEFLGPDSEKLAEMLGSILGVIGNLAGVQLSHQFEGEQTVLAMRTQVMHATFYRAMTTKIADEATTTEALRKINCDVWGSMPNWVCP